MPYATACYGRHASHRFASNNPPSPQRSTAFGTFDQKLEFSDQPPTASAVHFLTKLVFAAPASFLVAAWASQELAASFAHLLLKLVKAAPASFLSAACALQVASAAIAPVARQVEKIASPSSLIIEILRGNPLQKAEVTEL